MDFWYRYLKYDYGPMFHIYKQEVIEPCLKDKVAKHNT